MLHNYLIFRQKPVLYSDKELCFLEKEGNLNDSYRISVANG